MDIKFEYTKPDKWYALNKECDVLKKGKNKDAVFATNAEYYIQQVYNTCLSTENSIFPYYKYIVFDKNLQQYYLSYKGFKCEEIEDCYCGITMTDFVIVDPFGVVSSISKRQGIKSFKKAYLFMVKLNTYGGWKSYKIKKENKNLKEEITKLKNEILALKSEKSSIE